MLKSLETLDIYIFFYFHHWQSNMCWYSIHVLYIFFQLYNEEILDLLDTTRDPESRVGIVINYFCKKTKNPAVNKTAVTYLFL